MALRVVVLPAALAPRRATAFPSGDLQGNPFQNHDHIVVNHLNVIYFEHGACFLVCKKSGGYRIASPDPWVHPNGTEGESLLQALQDNRKTHSSACTKGSDPEMEVVSHIWWKRVTNRRQPVAPTGWPKAIPLP